MGADSFRSDSFANPATNGHGNSNGNGNGHVADGAPPATAVSPSSPVAPPVLAPEKTEPDPSVLKAVDEVLFSDIGVNTLLSRLKQSIASAKDFAVFLKRRGALEEEHANGLKKLCRSTFETIRKQDARHGSYARQLEEVMKVNERMAENGSQFGLSLHQMHEDLTELSNTMERGRKQWKQTGLAAESRVQEAEKIMEKAKAKYDSLANDYDRVKTGDAGAGRKFGIKGPKSTAQHEEDLQRKVQAADADYLAKVQAAQAQRQELVSTSRPQAVKAVQELVTECDSALTLQVQKFVAFNEKLLLNNGMAVSPVNIGETAGNLPPSLREIVFKIDNEKDFHQFVTSHTGKIPAKQGDYKYVKHPTLVTQTAQPIPPAQPAQPRQSLSMQTNQPPPSFSVAQPETPESPEMQLGIHQAPPATQPLSQSQPYNSGYQQPPPHQASLYDRGLAQQPSYAPSYPQSSSSPYASAPAAAPSPYQQPPQNAAVSYGNLPPVKPVFGITLDDLFRRDGTPVPMVVYQCIQGVDLFGLDLEGIYRIPGTSSHITAMKALFDNDASKVDFRNPETFHHDVNSVAGLLKQFFRDLPDPLLTAEHYTEFIDAARIDDDTVRRDSMHAIINALPDPNYATLRALVLHLNRVNEHSQANRMSTSNLGICFAPTIMGQHRGQIADSGLQARVIVTILDNVYQIFDED
ncbi:Rho GTPase-like protein activator [Mytilinidion resinicola]|uniref:Rho GTPase-like protein activator n=1 Tax=Mytilinidion resinicola TaxID=574789 RepID=A0A6A6Y8V4_9PEZI|nr:Rho GTPase-like protein activator [Mytilinidion resinicola]KAF2805261.1 Rho GTPase-like protein activator [Mytilinidion resinicola]